MRWLHITAFTILVIVFVVLTSVEIKRNALVIDEFAHLPTGVAYWRDGLFSMYDENPPFARYLISAPAVVWGAKMDYSRAGTSRRWEWAVGTDFRNVNRVRYGQYFLAGRSIVAVSSLGCALAILFWAQRLNGLTPALCCTALWLLDPNVIAHSSFATTDILTTATVTFASFAFWECLKVAQPFTVIKTGLLLGLALGTKFSTAVVIPVWIVCVIIRNAITVLPKEYPTRFRWTDLFAIFAIALLVLNVLYKFDGTCKPLGSYEFYSPTLSGLEYQLSDAIPTGNRFIGSWISNLPIPLPRNYILGFDSQMLDQQVGIFGDIENRVLVRYSPWYAPLRTLIYKLPFGTILLLAYGFIFWVIQLRRCQFPEPLIVLFPAFLIFVLCFQGGGLKAPLRYSLPMIPCVLILLGRPLQAALGNVLGKILIAAAFLCNGGSLLHANHSYLAYGNEIIGGTDGAQRVFLGSNYDWGQDLLLLKQWADNHPDCKPLALTYYGPMDPSEVGLSTRKLPQPFQSPETSFDVSASEGFYWVISSNVLHGLPGALEIEGSMTHEATLKQDILRPDNAVARIGQTLFVFRVRSVEGLHQVNTIDLASLRGSLLPVQLNDPTGAP